MLSSSELSLRLSQSTELRGGHAGRKLGKAEPKDGESEKVGPGPRTATGAGQVARRVHAQFESFLKVWLAVLFGNEKSIAQVIIAKEYTASQTFRKPLN